MGDFGNAERRILGFMAKGTEFVFEGKTYKVWLEDVSSLEPKLQLIKEFNLAGSAAWRLGQETSDVWELILKYVN